MKSERRVVLPGEPGPVVDPRGESAHVGLCGAPFLQILADSKVAPLEIQARIDRLPAANCHLTAADCGVSEAEQAKNWGCIVCRQVSAWLDAGRQLVVMTLVQNNGVRIFPSDSALDEPGLLLVLNRNRVSVDQMRLIMLHVGDAVDKVWLWMEDMREFRVVK